MILMTLLFDTGPKCRLVVYSLVRSAEVKLKIYSDL